MAEWFRDATGADTLLFVDNIFRFSQAGSEVSALLGRMPRAVGYQPTLATEMGELQERITSTSQGRHHLGAGRVRAGRRPDRPGPGQRLPAPRRLHLPGAVDRREGHLPGRRSAGVVAAASSTRSTSARSTTPSPAACSRSCSATANCRTSSPSSASTSCREEDKQVVHRARAHRAVPVAAVLRGRGVHRQGGQGHAAGRHDPQLRGNLRRQVGPPAREAFMYVGAIEQAEEQAKKMAAQGT